MKIYELFETELINDYIEIFIRDEDSFHVIAHGNWYQDNILNYTQKEIQSFTWQNDNTIYIDIKE